MQSPDALMQYKFKFGHLFDDQATQDDIFEKVGKHMCDGCIDGYNATVFAYGQTGSGKTFTIEGSYGEYCEEVCVLMISFSK